MKSLRFWLVSSLILAISTLSVTLLEYTAFSAEDAGKDVINLNNIVVNKKTKEIRIPAKLAIREGILEYLLVNQEGKAYESVFKIVGNKPSDLNFALLLIGSKSLDFETFMQLREDGKGTQNLFIAHSESLLEIEIHKEGVKLDPKILVSNREGMNKNFVWVHTGGFFLPDGKYAGDFELSYIGIWPDRSAVINLFTTMGNPYRGDFGLEMNKENPQLKTDDEYEIAIRRFKR